MLSSWESNWVETRRTIRQTLAVLNGCPTVQGFRLISILSGPPRALCLTLTLFLLTISSVFQPTKCFNVCRETHLSGIDASVNPFGAPSLRRRLPIYNGCGPIVASPDGGPHSGMEFVSPNLDPFPIGGLKDFPSEKKPFCSRSFAWVS